MKYQLEQLNAMAEEAFTEALGDIFEKTPAIARQAWNQRPFQDCQHLYQVLTQLVQTLPSSAQLELICAHPDLGSRLQMAEASVQEQASVGLNRLSPQDFEEFHRLNQQYRDRFGFPFIIAVRNHTIPSILDNFKTRLKSDRTVEQQTALQEILQIAQFRLNDRVEQA
ncbi:MAG: 2-oxo-4-hydroxy-4-carboxy-5-ureidoimidazoline decarboxylase [Synechococcales bacterium]|nr:2-oxo-4-hydroxy-4-carboxy-5-ureidoimidazoline decarboxylase [Synechococcales bacterium]